MGGPGGNEAPPGVGMTTASSPAPPASMPTPTHMQTPRTANSPAPPAASSAPTPAANKQRAPWPGDKANPLTVLFLSWLDGLLWRGYRKPLQDEDIYAAPIKHSAKSVRARVEAFQTRHPSASFTSVIVRAFFLRWLAGFTSKVVFICAYLLQPFWVGALVMYIDDRLVGRYNESSTYFWGIHSGLHLAAGLTVTSLVAILVSLVIVGRGSAGLIDRLSQISLVTHAPHSASILTSSTRRATGRTCARRSVD